MQLNIKTNLFAKDELFYVLALAKATGMPVLLKGVPGVGKTNAANDFARALMEAIHAENDAAQGERVSETEGVIPTEPAVTPNIFVLQATHESRANELTGQVNLDVLLKDQRIDYYAPASQADVIFIDEVDKGTAPFRNAALSLMNEKRLFRGDRIIPCRWSLFVGACNEIPDDEKNSPFWDRFVLKYHVSGLSQSEHLELFELGSRHYTKTIKLYIPTEEEINSVKIPSEYFKKFIKLASDANRSDRAIHHAAHLMKAATYVWKCPIELAVVRVTALVIGDAQAEQLSKELFSKEMQTIMNAVQRLPLIDDEAARQAELDKIEKMVQEYTTNGKLTKAQLKMLMPQIRAMVARNFAPPSGEETPQASA